MRGRVREGAWAGCAQAKGASCADRCASCCGRGGGRAEGSCVDARAAGSEGRANARGAGQPGRWRCPLTSIFGHSAQLSCPSTPGAVGGERVAAGMHGTEGMDARAAGAEGCAYKRKGSSRRRAPARVSFRALWTDMSSLWHAVCSYRSYIEMLAPSQSSSLLRARRPCEVSRPSCGLQTASGISAQERRAPVALASTSRASQCGLSPWSSSRQQASNGPSHSRRDSVQVR